MLAASVGRMLAHSSKGPRFESEWELGLVNGFVGCCGCIFEENTVVFKHCNKKP
jgi:hypothetical protein